MAVLLGIGGSSAGGNAVNVLFNITASSVTSTTFSVDKTQAEVSAAIAAGKIVRLLIQTADGSKYALPLSIYKADCSALSFDATTNGINSTFQITLNTAETAYEGIITDKQLSAVSVSETGTSIVKVKYITINGTEKAIEDGGAVHYTADSGMSAEQQAQARTNIDAARQEIEEILSYALHDVNDKTTGTAFVANVKAAMASLLSEIEEVTAAALNVINYTKAQCSAIAPIYSNSNTYAVGKLVMMDGALYRCTTAITVPEPFTPAKWTLTDIETELNN